MSVIEAGRDRGMGGTMGKILWNSWQKKWTLVKICVSEHLLKLHYQHIFSYVSHIDLVNKLKIFKRMTEFNNLEVNRKRKGEKEKQES